MYWQENKYYSSIVPNSLSYESEHFTAYCRNIPQITALEVFSYSAKHMLQP